MSIQKATFDDIPELVDLVQSCYRGDASRKGWTTEADILEGTRLDAQMLKQDMSTPGAVVLKYVDDNGKIIGCVYTELQNDKMYTGMLCVSPVLQTGGLGKKLMEAVDNFAKEHDCVALKLQVISCRKELIDWYERRGYRKTGEKKPFQFDSEVNGIPKVPLEFIGMQKDLKDRY